MSQDERANERMVAVVVNVVVVKVAISLTMISPPFKQYQPL